MSDLTRSRRSEHGFGLLFAIFALGIVGVLGFAMMTSGMIDMTVSDNFRSKSTAFYAADAGIEQTMIDLKVDNTWVAQFVDTATWTALNPSSATLTINGHSVTVQLDNSGAVIPGYYAFGNSIGVGKGRFTREIFLPPTLSEYDGDCTPLASSASSKAKSGSKAKSKASSKAKSGGKGACSAGSKAKSGGECAEELPAVYDVRVSIRSTGVGNQVEQGNQVLMADLLFTLDDDGNVIEIKVRNWRQN